MASTPEGKVKDKVKVLLKRLRDDGLPVYYHMPVQNGMGAPTLDFICCINGHYLAIEAKAPGEKPTDRQEATMADIRAAEGTTIAYDGSCPEKLEACLKALLK